MTLFQTYLRAIRQLGEERGLAIGLGIANAAIGVVQLAEPILFGAIVDALARAQSPWTAIGLWALIGIGGCLSAFALALTLDQPFGPVLVVVLLAGTVFSLGRSYNIA
jgi:hypothetical protein